MPFITKLDYSDNRQINQREKTSTDLYGATVFGLPFSGLTSGVDINNTGTTETYDTVTGNTFSGNVSTTIFTWNDSRMNLADSSLSAITPSNSGLTQDSGIIFTPNTSTVIDGNTVYLSYSGISLQEISVTDMTEVSPGNYTGTTSVDRFEVYSGGSIDFTGRTIWVDCTEIARTKKFIITENPTPGFVWTCQDSEGLGAWVASSGVSADTNTFITGATFDENTLNITRNDATIISVTYTGNTNSSCIGDFYVSNIHSCSPLFINPLDEGNIYVGSNSGFTFDLTNTRLGINTNTPAYTFDFNDANGRSRMFYNNGGSTAQSVILSGDTSLLTQMGVISPSSFGPGTTSLTLGVRGETAGFPAYGKLGDAVLYAGSGTNGINIVCQDGGTDKYIRMYAGTDVSAVAQPDLIILGNGDRGYVGLGMNTPTEMFDVAQNARFRNIGSNASAGALHYDANGVLTTTVSDLRMKSNVTTITGALDKVNNLRGVTYNWNNDLSGDTRIGFIAQEVEEVVPELAFVNERTEDKLMGVHYQDVTALLVEAVKELSSSGPTLFGGEEVIINSQTVASEDNNIELNYGGTKESALNGGIFVNKGIDNDTNSEFLIDSDGDWVTNNYIKAFGLILPTYTPTSSNDEKGEVNEVVADNEYIYVKTDNGWKRTGLETF